MVKEVDRKKAYHPRALHKDGCQCAPCKAKRAKGISQEIGKPTGLVTTHVRHVPAPPPPVRLDSLLNTARFRLEGHEHRVGQKVEGMVVCYNLFSNETVTLGGTVMVEPILE